MAIYYIILDVEYTKGFPKDKNVYTLLAYHVPFKNINSMIQIPEPETRIKHKLASRSLHRCILANKICHHNVSMAEILVAIAIT